MLQPDPDKRSTATQVRGKIQAMIDAHCDVRLDRAVPEDSQMPVASLASPDYSDIPAMLTKRWEMVSINKYKSCNDLFIQSLML